MLKLTALLALTLIVYTLDVPKCGGQKVPVLTFRFWNGTADEDKSTTAELCHD